jgi:hypothetical protein
VSRQKNEWFLIVFHPPGHSERASERNWRLGASPNPP